MRYDMTWQVGWSDSAEQRPEKMVPAAVPGSAQLDIAKAENYPPYWYGENFKLFDWMEDVYFRYRAVLPELSLAGDEELALFCGGVDYRYQVFVGGRLARDAEGMFTSFTLDLTGEKAGTEIEVLVFPVPKWVDEPRDRSQASHSAKPAVSYGWDWHPRLVPSGIWEDTYLYTRKKAHIEDYEVLYTMEKNLSKAELTLSASLTGNGKAVWSLFAPDGSPVFSTEERSATVERPLLWWPNGYGDQPLYRSVLSLYDEKGALCDEASSRVGFRTVSLELYENAYADECPVFPKTRAEPPTTLVVNGREIFAKGTNWVNPEIFPGTITRDTYEPLVKYAFEANMNIFRIWGGGIVNKDSFFDLCDECGILVWQEFPLACNAYPDDDGHYLAVLDTESKSIIRRLRSRASLAMWCGGNELFNSWSGMTDQALPLRLLNRNCYDLDPGRPFLYTSPLMGMGHGSYVFRYPDGREVFQVMPAANNTAYTEFGVPSPGSLETLRASIPPEELFPPRKGTSWHSHHAFDAWNGDTWLCPSTIEHYFGEQKSLEELVYHGQWLQNAGYQCIYEEARRQKPRTAMAINWCYNEPWPCAANNSLIEWPSRPKPSLAVVGASCRPVLASARIPKFAWKAGEELSFELWLLNDSYVEIPDGKVEVFIRAGEKRTHVADWLYAGVKENRNLRGITVRTRLPEGAAESFVIELACGAWSSEYRLAIV